jgi:hypothetical protein
MKKISRAETLSQSSSIKSRIIGYLMKKAIKKYYNFDNMLGLEAMKKFNGKIKIIRRTRDTLTSLDEKNIAKSSLTNVIIKKIIEEKYGRSLLHSTKAERNQWMDAYLSIEHTKTLSNTFVDDRKLIIDYLSELVVDVPLDKRKHKYENSNSTGFKSPCRS